MRILAIETSCDETAVSIIEASGDTHTMHFIVLGDALLSQMDKHVPYGGVFPTLAKREHQNNITPLLKEALAEAELLQQGNQIVREEDLGTINNEELKTVLKVFLEQTAVPSIDAVAVTYGPGLEPALWVGVTVAESIARVWGKPLIPINHMEGHLLASLAKEIPGSVKPSYQIHDTAFPVLGLLISGAHTELVLMKDWLSYELVGETMDDAVGEAFDKVARMLELPYPGGPQISRLAAKTRTDPTWERKHKATIKLPRPMLHMNTCDFSFSGLKTATLYMLRNFPELTDGVKEEVAREFEDAVADVLIGKTKRALEQTGARTLVIGGGVSANTEIRSRARNELGHLGVVVIPTPKLTTDNAVMIGVSAFYRMLLNRVPSATNLTARGVLPLSRSV